MGRSSLPPQHIALARQPQDAPDSQHSRGLTVHSFRSQFNQRRNDACNALVRLADAWRTLEIRDEASWAAYAADAGTPLTRQLVQHAVEDHAAMIESGYPSPLAVDTSPDDTARSIEGEAREVEMGWTDPRVSADNESGADSRLLAFVGLINALTADYVVPDLDDVAGATSAATAPR